MASARVTGPSLAQQRSCGHRSLVHGGHRGTYVAFLSDSSNLVPGDTNGVYDVFVRG